MKKTNNNVTSSEKESKTTKTVWVPGMQFFVKEETMDELLKEGLRKEQYQPQPQQPPQKFPPHLNLWAKDLFNTVIDNENQNDEVPSGSSLLVLKNLK